MKIIADLHIHSAHARGCSNRLNIENIWKQCIIKGIDLIGTGDFTHPKRLEEIVFFTQEDGKGFLIPKDKYINQWIDEISNNIHPKILQKLKQGKYPRFVLQTEINNVFARGDKKSRIHNCILIDSIKSAQKILSYFSSYGRVESDGRIALKQDQTETVRFLKEKFPQSIYFPAHIWTPYFGVLGSRFGYESMIEAYNDELNLIDAIETGLSSDPIMNRINPKLDPFTIISNSDAHSLENFAREGNIFDINSSDGNYTYKDLEKAIKQRKFQKLGNKLHIIEKDYLQNLFSESKELNMRLHETIEFYPQEGKYYGNGHAKCNYKATPNETVKRNGICPKCGKPMTIGVLHRIYQIGDQQRISNIGFGDKIDLWQKSEIDMIAEKYERPGYRYIVPLWDVIKETFQANRGTKKAEKHYNAMIKEFGSEFEIILDTDIKEFAKYDESLYDSMKKVRSGDIYIKAGYDGKFGIVCINECSFNEEEQFHEKNPNLGVQESLF